MKMLNNRDSFVRQVSLLIAGALQTFVVLTVVSNFGWFHISSLWMYIMSIITFSLIRYLWKN